MQQATQLELATELLKTLLLVILTGYLLTAVPGSYRAIAHGWDRIHDSQGLVPGVIELERRTRWDSFGSAGPTLGASLLAVPVGMGIYLSGSALVLGAVFLGSLLGHQVPHWQGVLLSAAVAVPTVIVVQKRVEERIRRSKAYRGW